MGREGGGSDKVGREGGGSDKVGGGKVEGVIRWGEGRWRE